jgi:hypothetical protein
MADDELIPQSLVEIVQPSRVPARPAPRRRSPPIASEDELTDSEISELERQLAARGGCATDEDEGGIWEGFLEKQKI